MTCTLQGLSTLDTYCTEDTSPFLLPTWSIGVKTTKITIVLTHGRNVL